MALSIIVWSSILFCHSRENGNPEVIRIFSEPGFPVSPDAFHDQDMPGMTFAFL
jgi:hypothetical protein